MPRNENINEMLEEIDAKGGRLNQWEINFIADMMAKVEPRSFTDKQANIITRIYDEKVD